MAQAWYLLSGCKKCAKAALKQGIATITDTDGTLINPDGTRRIGDRNVNLPNGTVIERDGVRIGGLGGAYSVDKKHRTEGRDWSPQEEPSPEEAERLIAECSKGPRLDILLTHDIPMGVHGLKGLPGLSKQILQEANRTRILGRGRCSADIGTNGCAPRSPGADGTSTMVEVRAAEQSWEENLVEVAVDADRNVEVTPLLIRSS
ncbi:MAG: hypothetical protein NVS2B15_12760 [Pseudarthrobacter sp.]